MPASKLPGVGTTIFTVMSRLAAETGAINLGQGFPDFDPPARLRELVAHHLAAGHNQYAPMAGLPSLCEAIAVSAARRHGWRIDPAAEITVTAGGTEALFAAIHAVVRAGEEVILLDPSYDSYGPAAELAGARVVRVPLRVAGLRHRLGPPRGCDRPAHPAARRQYAAEPGRGRAVGRGLGADRGPACRP